MDLKIFIFLLLLLNLNSSSTLDNQGQKDHLIEDNLSGIYFLHGTRINLKYDFPWPQWGGEEVILSADTVEVVFSINIIVAENKQDTLQFFGLDGANAGNSVLPLNCTRGVPLCAYAEFINGEMEFNIRDANGEYNGVGTLDQNGITLNTHFEFRSDGVDYILTGKKVGIK